MSTKSSNLQKRGSAEDHSGVQKRKTLLQRKTNWQRCVLPNFEVTTKEVEVTAYHTVPFHKLFEGGICFDGLCRDKTRSIES